MHSKWGVPREILDDILYALDTYTVVTITDRNGVITYANDRFCELAKYSREELVGQTHQLVSSGLHDPELYAELWRTIRSGKHWRGLLCNRAKDGSYYWLETLIVPILDESGAPDRYISIRSEATERHLAQERVKQLAYVDSVTRLPNRMSMLQTMAKAAEARNGGFCAFVSVSVDELSAVNDAFGIETGEQLLREATARLQDLAGPLHAIARLGAGVFGLFLVDLGDEQSAVIRALAVAEQVVAKLSEPLDLGAGIVIDGSVSVGCVLWADAALTPSVATVNEDTYTPGYRPGSFINAEDPSEVVMSSEVARKRARQSGGARRLRFFEKHMIEEARERVQLVAQLRQGIERDELRLFSQPIVDRDRRVIGEEVLLRWMNPERGLVPPDEFIPLAEQTGMIIEIGEWVLHQACAQLADWGRDPATQHLTLSVNLSERQIRVRNFGETVRSIIALHGVPSGKLRIELTESVLHTNLDRTVRLLKMLEADGVLSSLDDFGTGYSSLSYLRELPVQQLKIDQSFVDAIVEDTQARSVVATIVQLARTFDLNVVAEGVETEDQFQVLLSLGVDGFQGYLFSRPRPIEDVPRPISG